MMRDERGYRDGGERARGVPDGLLIGVVAFLLGMTILVWTATGLSGLFAKGAWPANVTFGHTPLAMRSLIARPHDIPGAWPSTPATQLSGYGLFWGLLIGQLMILVVLTVFVAGTTARWRAVRATRRSTVPRPPAPAATAVDRETAPPQGRGAVPESGSAAGRDQPPT
ncbi:type VI secretion protein, partial [Streptomyces longispororuber]|nr:type VI secretion protein [Streptomyces longispororuber]